MNTKIYRLTTPPRSKMALRLWASMMLLVLFGVAFMWVVQVHLFEQRYIDHAIQEVETRLEPVQDDLHNTDIGSDSGLLQYLSKITSGKMVLLDRDQNLVTVYNNGHLIPSDNVEEYIAEICGSDGYDSIAERKAFRQVRQMGTPDIVFEMGIPVRYEGEQGVVLLTQPLDAVYAVQDINRQQLVVLSLLLTLLAGVLAWVLARRFTRPIQVIKNTVNSLASGDLTATPGLHLKDEIGELSHSVEEFGRVLQRVDVLRKEVIANVSHELRSPLSLIIGYGDMLKDMEWNNEAERNEQLDLIIREAVRMTDMVDDIMDYSQFKAGYIKLNREPYNLFDIVESEVEVARQVAADYQVIVLLSSDSKDIPVEVDALKISQVMRNLLNNAINHTENHLEIQVMIDQEHAGVKVAVSNPGEPIPEQDRTEIWERYYRSQHQGSRRQGTGIGLSIVSTILSAHGMEYGVNSQDGKNIFWFRMDRTVQ